MMLTLRDVADIPGKQQSDMAHEGHGTFKGIVGTLPSDSTSSTAIVSELDLCAMSPPLWSALRWFGLIVLEIVLHPPEIPWAYPLPIESVTGPTQASSGLMVSAILCMWRVSMHSL